MKNDAVKRRLRIDGAMLWMLGFVVLGMGQGEGEGEKGVSNTVNERVESPADPSTILRMLGEQLVGVSQADLAQAMVDGVVRKYPDRVQWVGKEEEEGWRASGVEGTVMPGGVVYTRLSGMGTGVVEQFVSHWRRIQEDPEAGKSGLILDLRQVSGAEPQGVVDMASLFVESGLEIFRSGDEVFRSEPNVLTGFLKMPLVILVDGGTSGTGEALAAVLRTYHGGVLMGEVTAGRGFRYRGVDWEGVGRIRFALSAIEVAGEPGVSEGGVVPDILLRRGERESGLEVPELESDPWVKRASDLLKGVRLLRKSVRN